MRRKFYKAYLLTVLIALLSGCSSFVAKKQTPPGSLYSNLPDFAVEKNAGLDDVSLAAMSLIGTPYRWGGNTPQTGFDCSGLVVYVIKNTRQKNVPRTTTELGKYGQSLALETPSPGDLVFFGSPISHVGLYLGGGKMVHAPRSGSRVQVAPMDIY
jgi:cell wall-associated NlpC family hydrolase